MHKTDLQPEGGASPNHVALDETVIRINDQQYWLYAAIDPETNTFLHIRLFSTYTTGLTEIFLSELREKHDVETAVFLVDDAQWLQTPSIDTASIADTNSMAIGMPSNVYLEK